MLPYTPRGWVPNNQMAANDAAFMNYGMQMPIPRETPPMPHLNQNPMGGNPYPDDEEMEQMQDREEIEPINSNSEITIEIGGGGSRMAGRDVVVRIKPGCSNQQGQGQSSIPQAQYPSYKQ